jgi:antitoxin component HigA of HigAB toxin-antitoxin module
MKKIENKQQYYTAMAEIESYLQKGFSDLTEKEDNRLDELSRAVEAWELKEYSMPMNPTFTDILIYVMQKKGLSQTDLSQNLGVSPSLLSEILNGKKQPNIDIVKNLHLQFHIDGNILLESIYTPNKSEEKKSFGTRTGKNPPSKHTY